MLPHLALRLPSRTDNHTSHDSLFALGSSVIVNAKERDQPKSQNYVKTDLLTSVRASTPKNAIRAPSLVKILCD